MTVVGKSSLLGVHRLSTYGPVAATTTAGTLRPSAVKFGQGIHFAFGGTDRLLFPLNTGGESTPASLTFLAKFSVTPAGTRGLMELSGSTNPLRISINATTLTATVGAVTANLALSVVAGDLISVAVTMTSTTLTLAAAKNEGAVATATGTGSINETFTQVDIGLANSIRGDASIESVLVWRDSLSTQKIAETLFVGTSLSFSNDPNIVFAALTDDTRGLVAYTAAGTGFQAIRSSNGTTGSFRASSVESLEDNSVYTELGATLYIDIPASSGIIVGDLFLLDDGSRYQVVALINGTTRTELYAKEA